MILLASILGTGDDRKATLDTILQALTGTLDMNDIKAEAIKKEIKPMTAEQIKERIKAVR